MEFDEFSRTCDVVNEYFDETIDEVALQHPISRRLLVAVLAWAQFAGWYLIANGSNDEREVVYQSNTETLLLLDGIFWGELKTTYSFAPVEMHAARKVHERLFDAVDGTGTDLDNEREPVVVIEHQSRNSLYRVRNSERT